MNRTAIVTGSSSGFGLLTAIRLAEKGFHVLATMRNLDKAKVFEKLIKDEQVFNRIESFPLDVTDQVSIRTFAEKLETLQHIDVLVNNAGFAIGGFAEHVSIDAYRRQFETNVFGVMALTQVVMPKMRENGKGTIINVSSVSGKVGFPGMSAYVSSKYALEGYTESLRLEAKPFGVQVALVEPGSFQTNIWSTGMEVAEKSQDEQSGYHDYMSRITAILEAGKKNHQDPMLVADKIVEIAKMKEVKQLRYPIGKGLKSTLIAKELMSWNRWERMILRTIFKQK